MNRTVLLPLVLTAVTLTSYGQSPKADWRFAHPKPDLMLSVNLGAIAHSLVLEQALRSSFPASTDADRAKIDLAVKLIGSIERIQLSVRTIPGSKDADFLALITGDLDPMIRLMLAQSPQNGMVSKQISPKALLLGKAPAVDLAAKRMAGAAVPVILDALSSDDLWISGETSLLPASVAAGAPPGIDALKRFSLGMNFGDPLVMDANLGMANEDGAQKLMGLYSLLTMQAPPTPEAAAMLQATQVERLGAQIHFHTSVTAAQLQTSLQQAQAVRAGSAGTDASAGLPALMGMLGMSSSPAAAAPAPKKEAAPEPSGKIMIYGLDDGPREVGAPKKQD